MHDHQTQVQQYHSLYRTCDDSRDLQLRLHSYGKDAVEIELINQNYIEGRKRQIKKLVAVSLLYGLYCLLTIPVLHGFYINSDYLSTEAQLSRNIIVDLAFLLWLLYILQATFALIKSEKLLFCLDFGLQLQTEHFWKRRSNMFIPASNIHDIVINEVIADLDVHYVLIVRTKGSLFKRQPIITIFNSLRPSIDCLEMVYRNLNKLMIESI